MKIDIDSIKKLANEILFENRENGSSHQAYEAEKQWFEVIQNGDTGRVEEVIKIIVDLMNNPKNETEGIMPGLLAEDMLRNSKNSAISLTVVASRAAMAGGLEDEIAYSMSDAFIQTIEKCMSSEEVIEICRLIMKYFTGIVKDIKNLHADSVPVRKAVAYISKHMHESIDADEIAGHSGLCIKQLNKYFKSEYGMTVSEYIRNKRIDEAKEMLKYTDKDISSISTYLAFSSQSHFTDAFRKATGITPYKYRIGNTKSLK